MIVRPDPSACCRAPATARITRFFPALVLFIGPKGFWPAKVRP